MSLNTTTTGGCVNETGWSDILNLVGIAGNILLGALQLIKLKTFKSSCFRGYFTFEKTLATNQPTEDPQESHGGNTTIVENMHVVIHSAEQHGHSNTRAPDSDGSGNDSPGTPI